MIEKLLNRPAAPAVGTLLMFAVFVAVVAAKPLVMNGIDFAVGAMLGPALGHAISFAFTLGHVAG